nr:MAG: hypothetical protein [Microviridae sp.]
MKVTQTTGNKVQGTESPQFTKEEQEKMDELAEAVKKAMEHNQEMGDENRKIQVSLTTIQRMIDDEEFKKTFFKIAKEERELKAPMVLALTERELKQQKLNLSGERL